MIKAINEIAPLKEENRINQITSNKQSDKINIEKMKEVFTGSCCHSGIHAYVPGNKHNK